MIERSVMALNCNVCAEKRTSSHYLRDCLSHVFTIRTAAPHLVLLGEPEVVVSFQQLNVLRQLADGDGRVAHHPFMTARAKGVRGDTAIEAQTTTGQSHSYVKM